MSKLFMTFYRLQYLTVLNCLFRGFSWKAWCNQMLQSVQTFTFAEEFSVLRRRFPVAAPLQLLTFSCTSHPTASEENRTWSRTLVIVVMSPTHKGACTDRASALTSWPFPRSSGYRNLTSSYRSSASIQVQFDA